MRLSGARYTAQRRGLDGFRSIGAFAWMGTARLLMLSCPEIPRQMTRARPTGYRSLKRSRPHGRYFTPKNGWGPLPVTKTTLLRKHVNTHSDWPQIVARERERAAQIEEAQNWL